ncbi:MAG TPA: class I SAM-dependent methyltransferase [Longimicrobiales bacterium]|nr:class I SAM-dependent methyltransferase [Longimicrobiales bacterium]
MPTVILCVDGRPEAGAGHMQRSMAVASRLAARTEPAAVELVLVGPVTWRPETPLDGVTIRTIDLHEAMQQPVAVLGTHGPDVLLVLDCYDLADPAWLARFRSARPTVPLLAYEDGAPVTPPQLLGSIRPGLAAAPADLDVARGRFDAGGLEYIALRPGLPARVSRRDADGDGRVPHVLIAVGASDPERYAERIAGALRRSDVAARVTTVHGPMAAQERAGGETDDARFTSLHAPDDFVDRLARASVAVTGMGNTCHELLHMGVPVAAVAVVADQVAAGEAMERLECGYYLGRMDETPDTDIALGIQQCIRAPAEMERRAGRAARLLDGRGADRVAGHLAAVAAAYFVDRFGEDDVSEEFDRSAGGATDEHEMARWGSMASMVNRISLGRARIDWGTVDTWLDVGVGTGRSLVEIERHAPIQRFVGVDVSAEMLRFASSRDYATADATFLRQSFARTIRGEPFSLVTAFGVLQQCGRSLEFAMARLGELTATGGQVFITTKNAAWRRFREPGFIPEAGHHWFEPDRISGAFRWANLEIVAMGSFDPAYEAVSDDLTEHHSVFVHARKASW